MIHSPSWLGRLALVCCCLTLGACATGPNANPKDPFEPFNRSIYSFNDGLDRNVLKPVASTYKEVVPELVARGVGNFFGNLEDVWSMVNNGLQLKGEGAVSSLMRVAVNTVFGLGGVLDVATEMKIAKFREDFGQTLGYWGVGPGPYIVLPLLGPSTLRDTLALPVEFKGDLVTQIDDIPVRNTLIVTRIVDKRASLLKAGEMLNEAALDPYSFVRDAFLQRRRNAVFDGDPPEEAEPEPMTPSKQ